jgi:hypothetical protein
MGCPNWPFGTVVTAAVTVLTPNCILRSCKTVEAVLTVPGMQ